MPAAPPPGAELNWARNLVYGGRVARPGSIEELREVIAGAARVRPLGSRHSFNAIADSELLVDMRSLPERIAVDAAGGRVAVSGGTTYGRLVEELDHHGLALANLASLPHITIAGSIATGTHGSGTGNGALGTSVTALELITADGRTRRVARGDASFPGSVVALGALGAVVSVELAIEPAFSMRQLVLQDVPWRSLREDLRGAMSSAYSVSLFTHWDGKVAQAWVKQRLDRDDREIHPALAAEGRPAATNLHPVGELGVENCTEQLGVEGPSFERLPHFRMGFTPSRGDELQSEFLLDWSRADDAIAAMSALGERIRPLLLVSEVRAAARDDLWLSPAFERDSLAIHFTWRQEPEAVSEALRLIEAELLPLGARPHWGKLFLAESDRIRERYPRLDDFAALAQELDPAHKFRNGWLQRHVLGAPADRG